MSSMRLVGIGFVITMALLPAMLLSIARAHTEAADANVATVAASAEDSKVRAWQGNAKPVGGAPQAVATDAKASPTGATVVELFLPEAEATQVGEALLSAEDPQRVVLSFGTSQSKGTAGAGVDPFVPIEAGKRRRDYGRAMGKGPEPVGPVVVASPTWVRVSTQPTAAWAREQAIAAAAIGAGVELKLTVKAMATKGDERTIAVEFGATAAKGVGAMPEDAILNLFAAEPVGTGSSAMMRVVLVRSFKLPNGGNGRVELQLPAKGAPTRVVGLLQHAKTMHVLDTAVAEIK